MKRYIKSASYTYNGVTIYTDDAGSHVFTGPQGTGRIDFDTTQDAEAYIDDICAGDTTDGDESDGGSESKSPQETPSKYVVAKINRRDRGTFSNYQYLQPNGRYLYQGQNSAQKFSVSEAEHIVSKYHADSDIYTYCMMPVIM